MSAEPGPDRPGVLAELEAGKLPTCPTCRVTLSRIETGPRRDVSYVRDRIVFRCPSCLGSVGLDREDVDARS